LPPVARIAAPASAARRLWLATTPPAERSAGLVNSHGPMAIILAASVVSSTKATEYPSRGDENLTCGIASNTIAACANGFDEADSSS
jgi:hypothetical protein